MKRFPALMLLLIGFGCQNLALAVTVVLCEEENGERSYRKSCPPGAEQVDLHKYYVYKEPEPTPPQVMFYYVPDCLWCKEVREYFAGHEIDIIEKDLTNNEAFQQELLDKAGEMIVPTVDVEGAIYSGFNPNDLDQELTKFGYKTEAVAELP